MTGANSLSPQRFVLDSYAVIAFLEGEPGKGHVQKLFQTALEAKCELFISVINYGEIIYLAEREKGLAKAQEVIARLDELPLKIIDAGRLCTVTAAHIKARYPIAYADCFAAAVAVILDAHLVTGDPEFKPLESAHVLAIDWLNTA